MENEALAEVNAELLNLFIIWMRNEDADEAKVGQTKESKMSKNKI